MALSEVKNWADFQSRSGTLGDEMVYIGWDGLAEEKPCCTAEEWDSRLDEYRQGEYTGLCLVPVSIFKASRKIKLFPRENTATINYSSYSTSSPFCQGSRGFYPFAQTSHFVSRPVQVAGGFGSPKCYPSDCSLPGILQGPFSLSLLFSSLSLGSRRSNTFWLSFLTSTSRRWRLGEMFKKGTFGT
ncbi:hypothetical protein V8E54_015183 [Elaphomyces granulatus]